MEHVKFKTLLFLRRFHNSFLLVGNDLLYWKILMLLYKVQDIFKCVVYNLFYSFLPKKTKS